MSEKITNERLAELKQEAADNGNFSYMQVRTAEIKQLIYTVEELTRANDAFESLFKKCNEATKGMPIVATINGLRDQVEDLDRRLRRYVSVFPMPNYSERGVIQVVVTMDRRLQNSAVQAEQVFTDLMRNAIESLMRFENPRR